MTQDNYNTPEKRLAAKNICNWMFACNVKREDGKIKLDGMPFDSVKGLLQYCEDTDTEIHTVERDEAADCWDELNLLAHRVETGASDLPWIAKKLTEQREAFWNNPSESK
jgi:hypothetical protein